MLISVILNILNVVLIIRNDKEGPISQHGDFGFLVISKVEIRKKSSSLFYAALTMM